ncbi:SpoIIE family protein phosphatase [Actinoplanes derwentensis]|uniref:Serine phosphatase RsbU, regulator of sigma subunit n=1 Tax=Actinoplanes derwentensis TaxID=113562 RepID=A0A1H2D6J1_9ACTN|nr:SpoIIE family protein phosphatase [Actinoplanes derwentensis]GID90343.1 hypothetical protein Ade03nite_92670 [Actinoplanes derwentensis]SDT78360.1 Serine phosphatase RsbU, regulator of sigma subunit [Actinoplanes derwentensis]
MSGNLSSVVPVATDDAESLHQRLDMLRAACSAALSVDELIVIAVSQAKAATQSAGGVLFLLDGDELTVAAGAGYPPELLAEWSRFPVSANTPASDAARKRRAQWVSQPTEKARRYPELAAERTEYLALAALPIMSGQSMLGVLGISFRESREFSPIERLFLLLLAEQVGITLDRIRAADRNDGVIDAALVADPVRRRTVSEVLTVIDAARDAIDRSIALAQTFCGAGSAQLSLIGDDQMVAGGSGAAPSVGSVSPADESLCTVTMSLRAPLVVVDALSDDRLTSFPPVRAGDVRAYLGVPVTVGGVLVGTFCVYDRIPRPWSERQQQLLTDLASAIGTELTLRSIIARDAGLLDAAEAHVHLLESLTAAEGVRQAASVLLAAVSDMDGVAGAAVVVKDEQTNVRYEQVHCSEPNAAAALAMLAERGPAPDSVTVRSLALSDVIDLLLGDAASLLELNASQAVKAVMPGRVMSGSLVVALTGQADAEQMRRDLVDLAHFGGAVLDRAATYERHQLATSRAAFLTAALAQMEASLDVDETLQRMARIAVPALAEGCLVYLAESGGFRLAAASHLDARVEKRIRPELGNDPVFVRLMESALAGSATTRDQLPAWLGAERLRSTPLWARGKLIGAIILLEAAPDGLPRLADETLLADLSAHAAITIDNALLYTKRTAEVAALQHRLLPPRLPFLPEFDLAAFYEAGDRSLDVGGDFYDVIAVGEDRLVLVIGDVCGRGADAAAITGLARAVLRTVVQDGASPARALERLNDAMRSAGDLGELCTALVAQIDGRGDASSLRMAAGGHPLPLLRRAGVTREIGRYGPMLGMLEAPVFREVEVQLSCDDVVLLYTDGVTEARRGSEFFGSRLVTAVTEAGRWAEQTIAHTVQAVEEFRNEASDDVAMLALRPKGRSVARIEVPDVRDPSSRTTVSSLLRQSLPGSALTRRLTRSVSAALARVQLSVTGPVHVEVLRVPGAWRVKFSRPAPRDRPDRRRSAMTAAAAVPGSVYRVRHGLQILESVEVAAHDE